MRRITLVATVVACLGLAAGVVPPPVAAASIPPPSSSQAVLDTYAQWLVDSADGVRPNGLTRKVVYVWGPDLFDGSCTATAPCLVPDVEQSTAACTATEFLVAYYSARAAAESRPVSTAERTTVETFTDAVLAYQAAVPGSMFDGAIASDLSASQQYYTSFGNAACGQALLDAHELLGDPALLTAATDIGEYLLRMQDPRDWYAAYGAEPFVDAADAPVSPPGGYFDQVSSWNNLYGVMSMWNMSAVPFLQRLQDVTGVADGRYALSAALARDFYLDGFGWDSDWYTVRFSSPATAKNKIYAPSASSANCQDSRWHRKGSCVYTGGLPEGGSLGTDMIEYALAALYEYELMTTTPFTALTVVQPIYERFVPLPGIHTATATDPLDCVDDTRAGAVDPYYPPDNLGAVGTGDPWDYDPHLSFGGYFRSNNGTQLVDAEAKYYDIVGFGILAELRAALVPDKFAAAYERIVDAAPSDQLAAIVDRQLEAMALAGTDKDDVDGDGSTTERTCVLTQGTLPIAANGLGILATVGYLPSSPLAAGG